jgi:uncharacterized protein YraI
MRRLVTILLVFFLAACSAPTPTAVAPEPTQPPAPTATAEQVAVEEAQASPTDAPTATAEPTAAPEPSPTPEPTQPSADPALLGAAWEWSASERPGCDLLVFQADGSLSLQSGCQAGQGSYLLSGATLTLTLPAEASGDFAQALSGVTGYAVREGTLALSAASGEVSLAPRPLLQPAPPAEGSAAATLLYNARVFIGPGKDYPVVGILPAGSTITAAARIFGRGMWGVSLPGLPDGLGWIEAAAADVAPIEAVPYTAIEKLQVGGDALLWPDLDDPRASVSGEARFYAGPGEQYVLAMVGMPGDTFYILGKSEDGAYLVAYVPPSLVPGGMAWVKADQVETRNVENVPVFKNPPAPGNSRFAQPAEGQAYAAALTSVNVRGGPGVEYTVYKVAERGEIVLITARTPDGVWYRIRVAESVSSDGIAWISAPNVRAFNTGAIPVVEYPFPMPLIRTDTLGPLCQVVSQTPREYELFAKGVEVKFVFEIRNNTDFNWAEDEIDFVYIDNIDNWPMHTGPSRLDLEETVIIGNTTFVTIEAKTPTKHKGVFGERWVVRKAGQTVCAFTYQIRTHD